MDGASDSGSSAGGSNDASSPTDNSAADLLSEFAKLANMTPAEKIATSISRIHFDRKKSQGDLELEKLRNQIIVVGRLTGAGVTGDASFRVSTISLYGGFGL